MASHHKGFSSYIMKTFRICVMAFASLLKKKTLKYPLPMQTCTCFPEWPARHNCSKIGIIAEIVPN